MSFLVCLFVCVCNILFDFAGLFLVAILIRNLYTGDPCEGVRSLPPQTKDPRYVPEYTKAPFTKAIFVTQLDAILSHSELHQVSNTFETSAMSRRRNRRRFTRAILNLQLRARQKLHRVARQKSPV